MARILVVSASIVYLATLGAACVSSTEPAPDDGWIDKTTDEQPNEPDEPDEPAVEHRRAGGLILPAGTFSFMPPDKRVWLHTQAEALDPSGDVGIDILRDEIRNDRWPLILQINPFSRRDYAAVAHRDQWSFGVSNDLYAGVGSPFIFGDYVHLFQCQDEISAAGIWEFDDMIVECDPGLQHLSFYFKPNPASSASPDEPAIDDRYLRWFRHVRQATEQHPYDAEQLVSIKLYTYIRDRDTAYWSKVGLSSIHGFGLDVPDDAPWTISTACLPNFCIPRDQE